MKIKAKTGDLALGIFSILGGIIILILTKVQGLQLIKSGQMGPGFFPTICGIAIAICGAMVLLEAARRIARAKTAQAEKEELETNILNLTELKNLLLFMLLGTGVLLLSDYLGLLTLMVPHGTPLEGWVKDGSFTVLGPLEVLKETELFLQHVDSEGTVFRANHASNYLTLKGTLNGDREALLAQIRAALEGRRDLKPEFLRAL